MRELIDALPQEIAVVDSRGITVALAGRRAPATQGGDMAAKIAGGVAEILDGAVACHLDHPLEQKGRKRCDALEVRPRSGAPRVALISGNDVTAYADSMTQAEAWRKAELPAALDTAPIGLAIAPCWEGERIRGNPALFGGSGVLWRGWPLPGHRQAQAHGGRIA